MRISLLLAAWALLFLGTTATRADDDPPKSDGDRPQRGDFFKRLDKDGDGRVTASEVDEERRGLIERMIERADKNKDGALDVEEFRAGMRRGDRDRPDGPPDGDGPRRGPFGDPAAFFERADKNKDGKLTPDEVPEERREGFTRMAKALDTDGDGAVSKEEFAKGRERFASRERDGGPGGRGPGAPERPDAPRGPRGPEGRPREGAPPFTPGAGRPSESPPAPLFRLLDGDRDGALSETEIASASDALKKLDRDGDGKITMSEFPAGPPGRRPDGPQGPPPGRPDAPPGAPEARPGGPRPDGPPPGGRPEGGRSPEEMAKRLMERDANGDGKLSKDELPERMQRAFDRLDKNSDGSIDADELKQMRPRGRPNRGADDKKPTESSGPVEAD